MRTLSRIVFNSLLIMSLLASANAFARGGGFGGGGGFHGGDGGFHGNGAFNGGDFHDDGFRNNYNGYNYHADDGYRNNVDYNGVYVGVGGDDDDVSNCQSNQVCNTYGQCWEEQQCD